MKKNSLFYREPQQRESDIYIDPEKREEGELIEIKVGRIVDLKEPITDSSPYLETPANEGVIPEFDIRTDKFDLALDTLTNMYRSKEKVNAQNFAKDVSDEISKSGTDTGEE